MTDQHPALLHSTLVNTAATDAAPRVVFLHGLFGRGKNFARIAAGIAPEARSLLVDLPNHGQSCWTDSFDYAEIADLVAAHLRSGVAKAGPVDVVGHSMGGKVAMVLALRHPDLVRRLAVIDISPVASGSARGEFRHLLDALTGLDLDSIHRRADADAALRNAIPQDGVRGFLLQNLRRGDGRGTGGSGGSGGFEWEPNLRMLRSELETIMGFPDVSGRQFTGPVLWMRGDRSDYVRDEDAAAMRALFPRTTRMTVRGAGHWVHSEKPEEVIAALRFFLLSEG
ncbi:MAG: alpha/beta fold hydrolase [Leucobacter sp.]